MKTNHNIPKSSYGVLQRATTASTLDDAVEQMKNLGYAIIDSGYSNAKLQAISNQFERTRKEYIEKHGEVFLKNIDEFNTIRSPLTFGDEAFLQLVLNEKLLEILKTLIPGKFILNQQNGIVNPPKETYNQAAWHRDLPYQHFVSTTPLAINALFCIDAFTSENGATFVLPGSHKSGPFPSPNYVQNNAIQIVADAGSFILLDCMLFHAGGFNATDIPRRAVNHVFNIPFFKQQINLPENMAANDLGAESRAILGFDYMEPRSVTDYLAERARKFS